MSEQDEFERLDCSAVIADVWLMLDGECDDSSRARLQRHIDVADRASRPTGSKRRSRA